MLKNSRHLIVSFGSEGAVWLRQDDKAKLTATLVFDPDRVEGELRDTIDGAVYGYLSCLTATVAAALASASAAPDLELALRRGVMATRHLLKDGHGSAAKDGDGFPAKNIADAILGADVKNPPLQSRTFHFDDSGGPVRPGWSLLALHECSIRGMAGVPLHGIARRALIQGPRMLQAPTLRVGVFLPLTVVRLRLCAASAS